MAIYKGNTIISGASDISSDAKVTNVLERMYPVGALYIGTQNDICPMSAFFGTWELVATDRALWGGNGDNGGTTIEAGLPNITGSVNINCPTSAAATGAFSHTKSYSSHGWDGTSGGGRTYDFDASRSSSVYGNSTTVQPPAYVVNVWKRTA